MVPRYPNLPIILDNRTNYITNEFSNIRWSNKKYIGGYAAKHVI